MELGRKIAFQFGSQIYSKHKRRKEENIKINTNQKKTNHMDFCIQKRGRNQEENNFQVLLILFLKPTEKET